LTPAGYFREEEERITKVRLGDGAYFDNSVATAPVDDELEKDLKDPDTAKAGRPKPDR
jgi:hypothetical protein